ncbi:hypothetical protein Hanom_Chr07g00585421 [Helianthus anomalus]
MTVLSHLRRAFSRPPSFIPAYPTTTTLTSPYHFIHTEHNSTASIKSEDKKTQGKWLPLPPFKATVNGGSLGKCIAGTGEGDAGNATAIKRVMRCCPQLPRSLVQKLFRLQRVRRKPFESSKSVGDVHAPVQALPTEKTECLCTKEELKFLHDLELYKDSAMDASTADMDVEMDEGNQTAKSLKPIGRKLKKKQKLSKKYRGKGEIMKKNV